MSSVVVRSRALSSRRNSTYRTRRNGRWHRLGCGASQATAMSGRPKFSAFRPWVQPSLSKKKNGDSLRPRSLPIDEEERQANLKLAVFFAVVALLFALAEHLGHVQEREDANLGADSTALVSLTLSPPQRSGNRAGFSVRFRLSNGGNHSIFYPVRTEINMPIV